MLLTLPWTLVRQPLKKLFISIGGLNNIEGDLLVGETLSFFGQFGM